MINKKIFELAEKYNDQHGTPAKGHTSYCRIVNTSEYSWKNEYDMTINGIVLTMKEFFHGKETISDVRFVNEESCLNYLEYFTA